MRTRVVWQYGICQWAYYKSCDSGEDCGSSPFVSPILITFPLQIWAYEYECDRLVIFKNVAISRNIFIRAIYFRQAESAREWGKARVTCFKARASVPATAAGSRSIFDQTPGSTPCTCRLLWQNRCRGSAQEQKIRRAPDQVSRLWWALRLLWQKSKG